MAHGGVVFLAQTCRCPALADDDGEAVSLAMGSAPFWILGGVEQVEDEVDDRRGENYSVKRTGRAW